MEHDIILKITEKESELLYVILDGAYQISSHTHYATDNPIQTMLLRLLDDIHRVWEKSIKRTVIPLYEP